MPQDGRCRFAGVATRGCRLSANRFRFSGTGEDANAKGRGILDLYDELLAETHATPLLKLVAPRIWIIGPRLQQHSPNFSRTLSAASIRNRTIPSHHRPPTVGKWEAGGLRQRVNVQPMPVRHRSGEHCHRSCGFSLGFAVVVRGGGQPWLTD